jgi:hypothetical protein
MDRALATEARELQKMRDRTHAMGRAMKMESPTLATPAREARREP